MRCSYLRQRVQGGFVGLARHGYRNVMDRDAQHMQNGNGCVHRWIEPDPEQLQVWREAWDLLLSEQHTLSEICEMLHTKDYRYRNWFYAGWLVSPKAGIAPKSVRGNWKPVVTTEEFERGLEILAKRIEEKPRNRRHQYLLSGLI